MAEKILNVRIALKYDTYANWTTNNPILKAGEVAIATIPTGDNNNVSTSLPAVLMKVGDGTSNYNALPFLSAKAADVHAYAKKPEAEFIAWIKQIISTEGAYDTKGSAAQALKDAKAYTDALANGAVKANTNAISAIDTRMGAAEASITTLTGADTVEGSVAKALKDAKAYADGKDAAIAAAKKAGDDAQADVDALEAKVGTVPDGKTVVQMIADAQDEATYDDTALTARVAANEGAIATLNGDENTAGSVKKQVADAVAKIVADAPEAYDTLKEISDWISSHASDASAMNSQINTNKTDIANLKALVGTLPESAEATTVVGYIDEAIAALKIGDYAKAADLTAAIGRISTAEGKITVLEGKVSALEAVGAQANVIETVKVNGVALTPDAAKAVDVIIPTGALASKDKVAEGDLAEALADKINGKADQITVNALDDRVEVLEGKSHEHANKALLDTYTQTEVDLADAVTKKHEHTNKTELDKFVTGDKAKLDTAIQTVTAGTGLNATKTGTSVAVDFDDTITFVFNCGSSSVNI